jgi:tetratricopeptide (TPR) repeat protein
MLAHLCEAYAEAGKKEEAIKIYDEIHEMKRTSYVAPFILGMAAVALGKLDEAFSYYDQAYEQKDPGFQLWNSESYHRLKIKSAFIKDPRYKKIMDRLAFPQ